MAISIIWSVACGFDAHDVDQHYTQTHKQTNIRHVICIEIIIIQSFAIDAAANRNYSDVNKKIIDSVN